MRIENFSGGERLKAKLQEILKKAGGQSMVKVGFLEGAVYPDEDSTPVAMVAAIQNYGAPAAGIPARPFFTNMVRTQSPNWGPSLANLLRATNYDAHEALSQMGEKISSQLVESIKQTNEPALSPVTLMLRKMFGNHPEKIRGADVGEAARRVAAGEQGATGTQAKPLDWTGHMQQSVGYEVNT